jgi:soluble lytic murein transglycosylase-like protein
LPIAESALKNEVVSHVGAAGIWQFMPQTAREY